MSLDDFNLHRSFRRKPAQMNKFRKKHIFLFQNFLPLASFLLKKKLFSLRTGGLPPSPVYGHVRNLFVQSMRKQNAKLKFKS